MGLFNGWLVTGRFRSLSVEYTTASASHAALGYMSNYTWRLRRKTNYSPHVEGVKLPSEGCAGAFNRQ